MKFSGVLTTIAVLFSLLIVLPSCSNGKSPIEPSLDNSQDTTEFLPESSINQDHGRTPLAVYDALIDPVDQTFTVIESSRELNYHGALTRLYPNVLSIENYGWSANFWADIKLTHPLPNSGIIVFDPRVIAILPANHGIEFQLPGFNLHWQ